MWRKVLFYLPPCSPLGLLWHVASSTLVVTAALYVVLWNYYCILPYSCSILSYQASPLKARLRELVPVQQEKVKNIRKEHGDKVLGSYTVGQVCILLLSIIQYKTLADPLNFILFSFRLMVVWEESLVLFTKLLYLILKR